jgi:hypothetical protein
MSTPRQPTFTNDELTHIEHTLAKRPYRKSCMLCMSIAEKIEEIRRIMDEGKTTD